MGSDSEVNSLRLLLRSIGSPLRRWLRASLFLFVFLYAGVVCAAESLPERLSDEDFWKLIQQSSEPAQPFPGENYVSNEVRYPAAVRALKENRIVDGVYLGVGPEQNFTYISVTRSKLAFIIDIRRQNMLEHLMYKALFEMAEDRADFLSRLFGRKRPEGLSSGSTAKQLMDAFMDASRSPDAADDTLKAILKTLHETHGFSLSAADDANIEKVFKVFAASGPQTNYNSGGANPNAPSVFYAALMTSADVDGNVWSYLATEGTYQWLRTMQRANLIVPIVGDFGGPKAIRAVGDFLRNYDATVSVFYLSNVETYLFAGSGSGGPTAAVRDISPNGGWQAFFENVSTLPLDESSRFIRFQGAGGAPQVVSIRKNLDGVRSGAIKSLADLFK